MINFNNFNKNLPFNLYNIMIIMKSKIAFISLLLGAFFGGLAFYYGILYFPLKYFTNVPEPDSIFISLIIGTFIVLINYKSIFRLTRKNVERLFFRFS